MQFQILLSRAFSPGASQLLYWQPSTPLPCPALPCLPGKPMLLLLWVVAWVADQAGHEHDTKQCLYTTKTCC